METARAAISNLRAYVPDYDLSALPSGFENVGLSGYYLPRDSLIRIAVAVGGLWAAYIVWVAFYRLFLDPTAGFPGPKIAALTNMYEIYFDVVKRGKYIFKVDELHDKYGPIIRINPRELSIRDGAFYDQLYVTGSTRPTDRYDGFVAGVVDFEGSHLATIEHDMHRKRRKPLDPYFSRAGITKLEPMVQQLTEHLNLKRFESFRGTGQVVRLDHAFTAFSGDVINRLCLDDPPNLMDEPEFTPGWFDLFHDGSVSLPVFMGFPWLIHLIRLIPESVLMILYPQSQTFNTFKRMCDEHLKVARREISQVGTKPAISMPGGGQTLFRFLFSSSDMPASELSDDRISKEAQVIIASGTITSAGTMCFLVYHIMANPAIRERIQDELRPLFAEYPHKKPTWVEIERLPYFQAVIKEGLRLSYGTLHRRPRVSPKQALVYGEYVIPAGVPVGMSAYLMHKDEKVYPRAGEFVPERWLENVTPEMNRNFVPFSKGSRHCLGQNLAYCEVNLIIATLFRPGGPAFELFETDEDDVRPAHDMVVPLPSLESKGVRVRFLDSNWK